MNSVQFAPLRLKFTSPEETSAGFFSGYASAFGGDPDSYGDLIAPGAFHDSLVKHEAAGTRPAMLWHHDRHAPIGVWQVVREDSYGLWVEGKLTLEVEKARESYALLKDGAWP